jgi:hypothetical protein
MNLYDDDKDFDAARAALSAWFISQGLKPDEAIALMGCTTAELIRVLRPADRAGVLESFIATLRRQVTAGDCR